MKLRRYYEQLAPASLTLEENLNGLLDKRDLRFVHILSGRVDRLDANVCNLGTMSPKLEKLIKPK